MYTAARIADCTAAPLSQAPHRAHAAIALSAAPHAASRAAPDGAFASPRITRARPHVPRARPHDPRVPTPSTGVGPHFRRACTPVACGAPRTARGRARVTRSSPRRPRGVAGRCAARAKRESGRPKRESGGANRAAAEAKRAAGSARTNTEDAESRHEVAEKKEGEERGHAAEAVAILPHHTWSTCHMKTGAEGAERRESVASFIHSRSHVFSSFAPFAAFAFKTSSSLPSLPFYLWPCDHVAFGQFSLRLCVSVLNPPLFPARGRASHNPASTIPSRGAREGE